MANIKNVIFLVFGCKGTDIFQNTKVKRPNYGF